MSRKLLRICPMLVASLLLAMLLIGCGRSIEFAELPQTRVELRQCVDASVPPIPGNPGTSLTKEEVAVSLAEQRASALSKSRCAKDYDAWYQDLRTSFSK